MTKKIPFEIDSILEQFKHCPFCPEINDFGEELKIQIDVVDWCQDKVVFKCAKCRYSFSTNWVILKQAFGNAAKYELDDLVVVIWEYNSKVLQLWIDSNCIPEIFAEKLKAYLNKYGHPFIRKIRK